MSFVRCMNMVSMIDGWMMDDSSFGASWLEGAICRASATTSSIRHRTVV